MAVKKINCKAVNLHKYICNNICNRNCQLTLLCQIFDHCVMFLKKRKLKQCNVSLRP